MTYPSAVPLPAAVAPALIDRYGLPMPRYTSYPTAPHFHKAFDSQAYVNAHRRSMHRSAPLGLYMHLPFCRSLCTYCACHRKITNARDTIATYVQYLARELALVGRSVGRPVGRIHWGGGTPTYLSQAEVRRLMHTIRQHFDVLPSAQLNIEADPRELSRSYLDTLVDVGFRRMSLGVQAFDPQVQRAIGRVQPAELVARVVADARAAGMEQLNFDLIYGLPHQTADTVAATLDEVAILQPDSLSVFGYAHVPWMMKNQRLIPTDALPDPQERVRLFLAIAHGLQAQGYVPIGMDHFARPDHPLAKALNTGAIHRNFQGYTLHPSMEVLGFGVSAISQFHDAYAQNAKGFRHYYAQLDAGEVPTVRGRRLTRDDRRRRFIINRLMCEMQVAKDTVAPALPQPFDAHFPDALQHLRPLEEDGLVEVHDTHVRATPPGRVLIRLIAAAFDAYLHPLQDGSEPSHAPATARQHAAAV